MRSSTPLHPAFHSPSLLKAEPRAGTEGQKFAFLCLFWYSPSVRTTIATTTNLDSLRALLVEDEDINVRTAVAVNALDDTLRRKLINDPSPIVRQAVAAYAISDSLRNTLARDPEAVVRDMAIGSLREDFGIKAVG